MHKKNKFKAVVAFAVALAFILPTSAVFVNDVLGDITNVRFDAPEQTVEKGETFTVSYYVEPTDWVTGANFKTITFDPALLQADSVTEGDFFESVGGAEMFKGGTIDNNAGTISDGYAFVAKENPVYEPGSLYVINFTAKDKLGTSPLVMDGVKVAGKEPGQWLPVTVESGNVTVWGPPEFFNLTISVDGSGTTDPIPGTYTYSEGTVVDLEAIPDIGWLFDHWDGDVADPNSAITNITMNDDEDVTATFNETDTTPPNTTHNFSGIMSDNGWYISCVKVTLNATDDLSGVESTWYRVYDVYWKLYTRPFEVCEDGYYTVEYYSIDKAGNIEDTRYIDFKIDKTFPVTEHELEGFIGEDGWFLTNVTVTLSATDATSGVAHTMYKLDGGEWMTYEEFFIVTEDGEYNLSYYSVDLAGNTEMTNEVEFKIEKDVWPPNTTHDFDGVMGDNGWYKSNVVVALTSEDDSSGVAFTYYKLDDDTEWEEYTSSLLVTEDGEHTIVYCSVDNVGNEEPVKGPFEFKIDQTKPTIELTWDGENSKLIADVYDKTSGINRVEFYVDGEYVGEATEYPYEWIVPNPKRGDKGQAIVFDNAGNENISEEINAVSQGTSQSQSSSSTSTPLSRPFGI